ncbi:hypothetical protein BX661DRAFT_177902 [Kickxella alabastrina]|uniref:uncharacterized protein n=1 Tax=Kickxella alabastrina TaxID=61397 RepID=UPI00221F740B|nr:uncharacterized protein BX661DRAFT_177902 [Kickxella alabastrina]KAI7833973.1 hypothetical protein BX661DRAFT_177902 [Kickxella alabastrina]
MFGSTAGTTASTGGNLFGGFGASNQPAATTAGSLFGAPAASVAPSSGLFGAPASSAAPASNLFGAPAASAAPSSGLFGAPASSAGPSSGLFGSSAGLSAAAPSSAAIPFPSLGAPAFGAAPGTLAAPAFGAATVTAAPVFGSTTSAATHQAAAQKPSAEGAAKITRKTKFIDLPVDIRKMLEDIERQKQVQIQIGSSILAGETEKEVKEVSRTVQRLSQELEVVRMTLGRDRDRVDDARAQVNFAVKHAEKAASLVAHATDDGSWAQSGLTPLQVANRQKALLALQNGSEALSTPIMNIRDSAAVAAAADQKALGDGSANAAAASVDPYEAVRRIQFASMHHDVASEYYWAWLSRVEASAQLLAERLDQLERHVSGALAHAQGGNDDTGTTAALLTAQAGVKSSPKTVSDVIQYQNDSFLAIASRVAALSDDVRRMRKKFGLMVSGNVSGNGYGGDNGYGNGSMS